MFDPSGSFEIRLGAPVDWAKALQVDFPKAIPQSFAGSISAYSGPGSADWNRIDMSPVEPWRIQVANPHAKMHDDRILPTISVNDPLWGHPQTFLEAVEQGAQAERSHYLLGSVSNQALHNVPTALNPTTLFPSTYVPEQDDTHSVLTQIQTELRELRDEHKRERQASRQREERLLKEIHGLRSTVGTDTDPEELTRRNEQLEATADQLLSELATKENEATALQQQIVTLTRQLVRRRFQDTQPYEWEDDSLPWSTSKD